MCRYLFPSLIGLIFLPLSCSQSPETKPQEASKDRDSSQSSIVTASADPFAAKPTSQKDSASEPVAKTFAPEVTSSKTTPKLKFSNAAPDVSHRETDLIQDLLKMPEGDTKSLAITELARRWGKRDLDDALSFRDQLGDSALAHRAFYKGIDTFMAEEKPEELLDIIAEGNWWSGQWKAEKKATLEVAEYDIEKASTHFANNAEREQFKDLAYKLSMRLTEEKSFKDAEAFANSLQNPEAKGRALQAAVRVWVDEDPEAASRYVVGLRDPAAKDYAIRGMLGTVQDTNPSDSLVWAMEMQDKELRQETVEFLAKKWNGNEDNLATLRSQNGLSVEEREAIRSITGQ